MKLRAIILLTVFLLGIGQLFPREKQEKIGETLWYTEQNKFNEILELAKKENKPVMAVFSATWCKPCQKLKKEVFSTGEFAKMTDETLLLYIEQTDPKGTEYCKQNKIRAFPTIMIFSPEGNLLDTNNGKPTTEEFLAWVKDVKGGNNAFDIARQLEKEPNNRELIMKMTKRLAPYRIKEKLEFLEKLIELKPDPQDSITHEAYEMLIAYAPFYLMNHAPDQRKEIAQTYEKHLKTLIKEYYPDKFRYMLKPDSGIPHIVALYNNMGQYKVAYKFFTAHIKKLPEKPNYLPNLHLYSDGVNALLHLKKEKEAVEWLEKIKAQITSLTSKKEINIFGYSYLNMIENFIQFYAKNAEIAKADKYVEMYLAEAGRFEQNRIKELKMLFFAKTYGVYLKQTLDFLDKKLEKGLSLGSTPLICDKARILYKLGDKEKARILVTDFYKNSDFLTKAEPKMQAKALNNLAWVFVELEMIDEVALDIAEKSVKSDENSNNLDTLARIYAYFGNPGKAIELEEKALKKAETNYQETEFKKLINEWKTMVK